MKRYLWVSIACTIIGLYAASFIGCATVQQVKHPQPHCVINTIYCAWTWGTFKKDQVRIAVTNFAPGMDHSQAQALINGKWTYLTEIWTGNHMEIQPYKKHVPQEPYRYLTLKQWIDEQIGYVNQ